MILLPNSFNNFGICTTVCCEVGSSQITIALFAGVNVRNCVKLAIRHQDIKIRCRARFEMGICVCLQVSMYYQGQATRVTRTGEILGEIQEQ